MASRRTQRSTATVLSVLGHAALVALLTYGVPLARTERSVLSDGNPIESVMIDSSVLLEEFARIEAAELAEVRAREEEAERIRLENEAAQERQRELERQQQAEQERIAAAALAAQAEAEAEALRLRQQAEDEARQREEAEKQRLAEEAAAAERRRLAEEQRAREEAERRERERQEELARQEQLAREAEEARRLEEERRRVAAIEAQVAAAMAAEQRDREAREAGLRDQWARAIGARVESRWNRPPNAGSELECLLIVTQLPSGQVREVTVEDCNTTDPNIIRSLENAVVSASPLPQRPEGVAFESVLHIRFKPTD